MTAAILVRVAEASQAPPGMPRALHRVRACPTFQAARNWVEDAGCASVDRPRAPRVMGPINAGLQWSPVGACVKDVWHQEGLFWAQ